MKRTGICAARLTTIVAVLCSPASGLTQSVTPAAGYIYTRLSLTQSTQSCVAVGPGGTYVGVGPGFTGAAQSVVLVSESGAQRTVVSGFNSIGDCVYDAATDVLYVSDNALEAAGAVTGDTVFAVPAASVAEGLSAAGLELAAAGSIPAASGLALDAQGSLYIGNAAGSGLGSIHRLTGSDLQGLVPSGLQFVGGLAFESDGNLLVAESLPSLSAQVSRYDATGALLGVVSGPTSAHGSIDLRFNTDGRVLVTGLFAGNVVSLDPASGAVEAFASGLTFATGVDMDPFTGRVEMLSSTFSFPDPVTEDLSVHRFTPVDRLAPGGGAKAKDCIAEIYGAELVAAKPGKPAKAAICTDGAACDADRTVNERCLFPIGFCLDVTDPSLPDCDPAGVAGFEVKKVKPASAAIETVAAAIAGALPVASATCAFSDGVEVPVKVGRRGALKPGKGLVKVKATSADAKPSQDTDTVRLLCLPGEMGSGLISRQAGN